MPGSSKKPSSEHAAVLLKRSMETLKSSSSKIDSDTAEGAMARGQVFELVGYFDRAVDAYADAVRRDCSNNLALARLTLSQLKVGDYEAGLESAIKLTSADRDFQLDTLASDERVSSMTILGVALILNERTTEAHKALTTALEINASDSYAAGRLAQLLLTAGNVKDAVKLGSQIGDNPRFSDLQSVLSLAANDPSVLPAARFSDFKELVGVAVPGRPLTIDGEARLANLEHNKSWRNQLQFDASSLDDKQRQRLGAAWASMGRGEHASVASFARFVLQLMQVGAPAQLVQDAIQAMADEVEHAKLCFGLASDAIGADVGPGRLDLEGIIDQKDNDLRPILASTITEGCVEETIAAAHAKAAAELARDETVRFAFAKIAHDEESHSRLAWRFVEWMLDEHPDMATDAAGAFETAIAAANKHPDASKKGPASDSDEGYGKLDPRTEDSVTRRTLSEYIQPRAAQLCATGDLIEPGKEKPWPGVSAQLP